MFGDDLTNDSAPSATDVLPMIRGPRHRDQIAIKRIEP
jgi:hypothetical protein